MSLALGRPWGTPVSAWVVFGSPAAEDTRVLSLVPSRGGGTGGLKVAARTSRWQHGPARGALAALLCFVPFLPGPRRKYSSDLCGSQQMLDRLTELVCQWLPESLE